MIKKTVENFIRKIVNPQNNPGELHNKQENPEINADNKPESTETVIEGMGLSVIKDSYTGLNLECKIGYSVQCTFGVIDEKTFELMTSFETPKDILKKYIDACFDICFREAFPCGAEYEELPQNIRKISDFIKNKITGISESNGMAIETLVMKDIVLDENDRNMFERMRMMKSGK